MVNAQHLGRARYGADPRDLKSGADFIPILERHMCIHEQVWLDHANAEGKGKPRWGVCWSIVSRDDATGRAGISAAGALPPAPPAYLSNNESQEAALRSIWWRYPAAAPLGCRRGRGPHPDRASGLLDLAAAGA
ncbi:hypothetical protein GCM10008024_27960 [Allgaiera indica]|uniref:Uncharacterized protein n=1 Tax=Allgaiera indica TaxID=765699 RepID=A0AAN4UT33_9RHOB|nr:hypothetical protein GCM10008024_27960 [Allgaiera indica]